MSSEIIWHQDDSFVLNKDVILVKHIDFDREYTSEEITSKLLTEILQQIPEGIDARCYLDEDGEGDFLEVISDREWITLGVYKQSQGCFYSFNQDYVDTAEAIMSFDYTDTAIWTKLVSGGQSPIPKMHAIQNIALAIKAVEYFFYTGNIYPQLDWFHEF